MNELEFLINYLIAERNGSENISIPKNEKDAFDLFRALVNMRPPKAVTEEFLTVQDRYLKRKLREKGITDHNSLREKEHGIYLWQGDITTLKCGAIVNAANSAMLGCFCPCHGCIDNAIHTFAGVQLRLECAEIMNRQGHDEPVGQAKITNSYDLPCDKVIHTVGPYVSGKLTEKNISDLQSCYLECLKLAAENNISNIAFCCISTGEFHFPNEKAAQIAVKTVRKFLNTNKEIKVIFNVFKNSDLKIYEKLLG